MGPDSDKIKTIVLPRLGARKIKTLNNEKERPEAVFKELVNKNKWERSQDSSHVLQEIQRTWKSKVCQGNYP